jgi:hypothetical protein
MKGAMKMTSGGVLLGNVFNVVQHCASGALFNCAWPKALVLARAVYLA